MASACVICGKDQIDLYRPFCSKRCADIDLGKWLGDGYRVQGSEEEDQASAELIDLAAERQIRQK